MAITLEIQFTEEDAGNLWNTRTQGFFTAQQDRFEFNIDSTEEADAAFMIENEDIGRGTMRWCNSYLDARFLQSYLKQADGVKSVLLWDLAADYDDSSWVVWADEVWPYIGPLNEEDEDD
tara:strand:- start:175 stop:534 length:360 start_codon:yes stop_codon:yes gene_type:complete